MHYKNGREAKVGDPVVGKGYNFGMIAGTLLSITPDVGSCNCMVGILAVVPVEKVSGAVVASIQGTEQHGAQGPRNAAMLKMEYSQCDYLLHAEDAMARPLPLKEAIDSIAPYLSEKGSAYLSENEDAWKDGVSGI